MPRDTREVVDPVCTRGPWSRSRLAGTLVGRNCLRRTANDELEEDEVEDAHETEPVGVWAAEGGGVSASLRALSEMRKRERLEGAWDAAMAATKG
jgi:hypothetical protein